MKYYLVLEVEDKMLFVKNILITVINKLILAQLLEVLVEAVLIIIITSVLRSRST